MLDRNNRRHQAGGAKGLKYSAGARGAALMNVRNTIAVDARGEPDGNVARESQAHQSSGDEVEGMDVIVVQPYQPHRLKA